jgi:hypothetical protein
MQENWKVKLEALKKLQTATKNIKSESFAVGKVLKMAFDESDGIVLKEGATNRDKYFVIIGIDANHSLIGAFLINSNINENVITTKELLDCQFPLKKTDYDFLKYDSYLNCSQLFELSKIKVLAVATEEGELTTRDKELVREHILNSEVISIKQKKRFNIVKN